MMRSWSYACLMLLCFFVSWSQDTSTIMFYNILDFPEAPPNNRELILKSILDEVQPDIFMVAELQNQIGADLILNQALNDDNNDYVAAPFLPNTSGNGGSIQQLLYYDSTKFSLEFTDVIQTSLRDINRYQLKALTSQSQTNPVLIDFFVAHFKASQGTNNEQIRFDMALNFTNYINANLDPNANVIFAGDFNFYSANENGVQQLLSGNNSISMNDPINQIGNWHINSSFSAVHTQSTRESNNNFNDFGAGGGLDDRFDFIFVSDNILNSSHDVHYVDGSYQAYGNNGNCFNEDISDTSCSGNFSQNLRNLLWNMSDHLPIVMDLEFEQNFLTIQSNIDEDIISFPNGNLVQEYLSISINPNYKNKIDKLYFYNTLGQQIKMLSVDNTTLQISLDGFSSGIYFLKASNINPIKFVVSR